MDGNSFSLSCFPMIPWFSVPLQCMLWGTIQPLKLEASTFLNFCTLHSTQCWKYSTYYHYTLTVLKYKPKLTYFLIKLWFLYLRRNVYIDINMLKHIPNQNNSFQ